MANISMHCHHATPAFMADSINVAYEIQDNGRLWLRYFVECSLRALIIPEDVTPQRADGLWNATCFELFLQYPDETGYLEFNFSPSGAWAAYRFQDYRTAMVDWPVAPPEIGWDCSETHFALEATVALPEILHADMRIGLSAVLQERGDIKSYWALHHPPGKPDFHHRDCFALHLAAPENT